MRHLLHNTAAARPRLHGSCNELLYVVWERGRRHGRRRGHAGEGIRLAMLWLTLLQIRRVVLVLVVVVVVRRTAAGKSSLRGLERVMQHWLVVEGKLQAGSMMWSSCHLRLRLKAVLLCLIRNNKVKVTDRVVVVNKFWGRVRRWGVERQRRASVLLLLLLRVTEGGVDSRLHVEHLQERR